MGSGLTRIRDSSGGSVSSTLAKVRSTLFTLADDPTTKFSLAFVVLLVLLGIFGPMLAPYETTVPQYSADGDLLRGEGPSLEHPLGTTTNGYDILSRVLVGARPTFITGLLGGSLIISLGLTIGVVSGYVGGTVDNLLMRFTDLVYGIPLIPFTLVLLAFFSVGFYTSILVIGLVLWRGPARALRSQVLQIKQRPFIISAQVTGASTPRIMVKHIIPNIATMAAFFFALGVANTILLQAGLAFLGASDPGVPSWGIMIRNAYSSGQLTSIWTWSIVPGALISLTVLSVIMLGRSLESLAANDVDTEGYA